MIDDQDSPNPPEAEFAIFDRPGRCSDEYEDKGFFEDFAQAGVPAGSCAADEAQENSRGDGDAANTEPTTPSTKIMSRTDDNDQRYIRHPKGFKRPQDEEENEDSQEHHSDEYLFTKDLGGNLRNSECRGQRESLFDRIQH